MQRAGRHHDEVAAVDLTGQRLDEKVAETPAGPFEKGGRCLEARLGGPAQRQATEGELQAEPLALGLSGGPQMQQAEPFPVA